MVGKISGTWWFAVGLPCSTTCPFHVPTSGYPCWSQLSYDLLNPPLRISLDACRHLVFDEADKLLDLGFAPQIDELLSFCPKVRNESDWLGAGCCSVKIFVAVLEENVWNWWTCHTKLWTLRYGENFSVDKLIMMLDMIWFPLQRVSNTVAAGGRWQTDADNDVLSSSGKVQQWLQDAPGPHPLPSPSTSTLLLCATFTYGTWMNMGPYSLNLIKL